MNHWPKDRASSTSLTMTPLCRALALAVACCVSFATLPSPARSRSEADALATVTVTTKQLGAEIPKDFIGLSLEIKMGGEALASYDQSHGRSLTPAGSEQIVYALGHPGAPNTAYFQFMRDLGPGVLRLGGNSQDNSCWNPRQAPRAKSCQARLTPGDLALFSRTAAATGWKLLIGLNLKQNSPDWALDEVKDGIARQIPANEILALEIGNEPDLFYREARPVNYSVGDLLHDFLAYVRAFQTDPVASRYQIAGPAVCCSWRDARDLAAFIDGAGAKHLKLVTLHNYSATTCNGHTVTISQLLAPQLMASFNSMARTWVAAVHQRGLPIAMAETNSASCGGMPGVSNAFASATWGLDYAFSLAKDGFRYVNFHSSYRPGGSSYNPIDTYGGRNAFGRWQYRNVAEPLYYALYLFARNASGRRLLSTHVTAAANVRAYAVTACPDCAVNVFVINKDLRASGRVQVIVPGRQAAARLLLVRAPRLSAGFSALTYGGERFDSSGRLGTPGTVRIVPDSQGRYTFDLPNAAIALLSVGRG